MPTDANPDSPIKPPTGAAGTEEPPGQSGRVVALSWASLTDRARLHGDLCWVPACPRTDQLAPAGYLDTTDPVSGARYGWAVQACPEHQTMQQEVTP